MTAQVVGIVGGSLVLLFMALDAWDVRQRREAAGVQGARWSTVWFLVAVSIVFAVIQIGLTLILPQALAILKGAERVFLEWRGQAAIQPLAWWQFGLIAFLSFYFSGLLDYLGHRFFNHSPWFWWTHEYHHLPREVYVFLPGLLIRPFAGFTTVAVVAGTLFFAQGLAWACGWPVFDLRPFLVAGAFNIFILLTSHSSFLRRWVWPHYLMRVFFLTTPHEHLLHHAVDRFGNYGNVTTLWDRLFGTYQDPFAPENLDVEIGLDYDQDFLGVLTWGRLKLPKSWRDRFQLERYCRLEGAGARPVETSAPEAPAEEPA